MNYNSGAHIETILDSINVSIISNTDNTKSKFVLHDGIENKKSECKVCFNEFNKKQRRLITCPACQYDACSECIRKFLLSIYLEPHCMNCHVAWSNDFWRDAFPKSFINGELRQHRMHIILDKEKSLLPLSMADARRRAKLLEYQNIRINAIKHAEQKKLAIYNFAGILIKEIDGQIEICEKNKDILKKLSLDYAIEQFEVDYSTRVINKLQDLEFSNKKSINVKRHFVRSCPAIGCKGLLSTQWKCSLCSVHVCHECHDIIDKNQNNHICIPENVATAKLIAKDTKPCPSCTCLIFRISGCSQMWCTQCNNAFDWNTGDRIDQRILHNPHFYEWRQTNAHLQANNSNTECNDMPTQLDLQTKMRYLGYDREFERKIAVNFLSAIYHNSEVEMMKFRVTATENDNNDLRINFLLNIISEKQLAHHLYIRDKYKSKKREIFRVMELFDVVTRDITRRLMHSNNINDFNICWNDVLPLIKYCNTQMGIISKRYDNKTPYINSDTYRWT